MLHQSAHHLLRRLGSGDVWQNELAVCFLRVANPSECRARRESIKEKRICAVVSE